MLTTGVHVADLLASSFLAVCAYDLAKSIKSDVDGWYLNDACFVSKLNKLTKDIVMSRKWVILALKLNHLNLK